MRKLLRLGLWCCCTLLSVSATAAGEVLAGPWMVLREDGGMSIGLEIGVDAPVTASLEIVGAAPLVGQSRKFQRPDQLLGRLIEFNLSKVPQGAYTIRVGSSTVTGCVGPIPAVDARACIALAGAWNYPNRGQLELLAKLIGEPIQLVVILGDHIDARFGGGGWEDSIPVVFVRGRSQGCEIIPKEARQDHAQGMSWGCLGLPAASGSGSGQIEAIARDLSEWQVFVDTTASWDESYLSAIGSSDPNVLRELVKLCDRMHIPLILGVGSTAGFISEPLGVDDKGRVIAAQGGGPRYLVATAAGTGLAELSEHMAEPIDGAAITGISATTTALDVAILSQLDISPPVALHYQRTLIEQIGPGWGAGSVDELKKGALATPPSDGALHALSWLAAPILGQLLLEPNELSAVMASSASDADARRLVRRYAAALPEMFPRNMALPAWLRRDLAFRQIGRRLFQSDGYLWDVLANDADQDIVRAVLRAQSTDPRGEAVNLLVARLRRQSEGVLALEDDPILQHQVLSAVFDSPYLSPTLIRPLAVALKKRDPPINAASRGPVDRFLDKYGEIRPP
jgi:hypothetical protein